jgi:hypothetical protein
MRWFSGSGAIPGPTTARVSMPWSQEARRLGFVQHWGCLKVGVLQQPQAPPCRAGKRFARGRYLAVSREPRQMCWQIGQTERAESGASRSRNMSGTHVGVPFTAGAQVAAWRNHGMLVMKVPTVW